MTLRKRLLWFLIAGFILVLTPELFAPLRPVQASTVFKTLPTLTTKSVGYGFSDQSMRRNLGMIFQGTKVTLIAYTDRAFYVQGTVSGNERVFWMKSEVFEPLPGSIFETMNSGIDQANAVNRVAGGRDVAFGMTEAQVRSSLGAPDDVVRSIEEGGEGETVWKYYRTTFSTGVVYGAGRGYGFRQPRFYYQHPRIRAGGDVGVYTTPQQVLDMAVTFKNGVVTGIKNNQ